MLHSLAHGTAAMRPMVMLVCWPAPPESSTTLSQDVRLLQLRCAQSSGHCGDAKDWQRSARIHLDHVTRQRCRISPIWQLRSLGGGYCHWSACTRISTAKPTPNTIGSTIVGTNQLLITGWLPGSFRALRIRGIRQDQPFPILGELSGLGVLRRRQAAGEANDMRSEPV